MKYFKKDSLSGDNWKLIYRGNDLSVTLFTFSSYGMILALISGTAFIKRNMNVTWAEFLKMLQDQSTFDKMLVYVTLLSFGLLFFRCRRTLIRVYRNSTDQDQYALIRYNWLNVPRKQICSKRKLEWIDKPNFLQNNLLGTMQLNEREQFIFDERYFESPEEYYAMKGY